MPPSEHKTAEQKKLPGIFISYRRSDNPDAVGRIYDRLVSEFGKARVFKDVDSIPLGQDFRGHLNDIVGGCAAVLAIIGPKWTEVRNEAGQKRLDDPDDFVRIELEAALARSVPVVPVLVGHAPMPGTSQLPSTLSSLAFRQSIEVRPDPDFHNDASRLVSALKAIIDPNAPQVEPLSAKPKRSAVPWLAWTLAVVAMLAAIALAIPALKHLREKPPLETRTEIHVAPQSGVPGTMALSPDGRQIVFADNSTGVPRLWLRALSATTALVLPGTEGAATPFWSPDSRSIGFYANSSLKRIDLGSGTPLTLAPASPYGQGGSWNAQGVILFSQGLAKPIVRIAATGGVPQEATRTEKDAIALVSPVFLPDGRRFVYALVGGKAQGTYLGSLDSTASVRLSSSVGSIAYLPSGWLLNWKDPGVLVAQRLDADKAVLVGEPVTLAEGVIGAVSVSATGLVAYWNGIVAGGKRQLQWRSRAGGELGSIGEPDETYMSPRVSPDGRRVAVTRGESGKQDLWLLEGERASRVTFDGAGNLYPAWSPDGNQIAFGSSRGGTPGIYVKRADGVGEEQLLLQDGGFFGPASWSADGRFLAFVRPGNGNMDIGFIPMTGDRKSWTFLDSVSWEGGPEFSPDGKWVAYQSDETKRPEIYIRPFVAPAASGATTVPADKWQVSTAGGTQPRWSPSGKELFFLGPAGEMMAAAITFSGSALVPGTPVKLFQTRVFYAGQSDAGPQYDVARDGRFLINTVLDTAATEASPIILIQNWNPDTRK